MANLDLNDLPADLNAIRSLVRRSENVRRIRIMMAAAGLASLGIVAVAGTLLGQLF